MPFLAILRHDLRTLTGTWLVRLWLAGTLVLTMVLMMGNWQQFQTAPLIASLLFPYLVFPWFLVVMVLGISPVSGARVDALADGLLSRPVTRYEYLLATWLARVVMVLGVYLVVVVPSIWMLSRWERPVADDTVTLYGLCGALGVVGLVLTFQVSLAFLVGTVLRKPVVTMVVLLFLWGPVNGILNGFQLEEFSPISLSQAIPTLLRQPWSESEEEDLPDSLSEEDMEALDRQTQQFLGILSGTKPPPPPKETPFAEREEYKDFSLRRVALAYGGLTVLAVGLATALFCRRDL